MRAPIYIVAIPILAVVAFAQDTPPAQQKQTPDKPATATQGQGQTDRADGQNGSTPAMKTSVDKSMAKGSDAMPEMKTQTYSGTLMNASCAGSGSAATPATSASSAAASSTPASSADRSASSGSGDSCGVSSSTTQFALKMKDGKTVSFDDVGNARVQEAIKAHKKWSESASASKPIHVKASGVLNADKLTVISVN